MPMPPKRLKKVARQRRIMAELRAGPTGRLAERIESSGVVVHVAEPAVQDETVSG